MAEETPSEDDVKKKAMLRPPNRRRYEEQLEQLMQSIRTLEARLKSLGRPQQSDGTSEHSEERDLLLVEQKKYREEKEESIPKRKALDDRLKTINEHISKQSDSLSKLEAGLACKTEAAVDDAIQKLEYQLRTRHFKLSEENRIVKEIDSLRRSKKKVMEYLEKKEQIIVDRAKRKCMKEERDKYFRLVASLKAKENEVKQKLMKVKSKTDEAWSKYREAGLERDALKKEIDDLYERRRQLMSDFKQQNSKYQIQQKQHRADSFRRKEEEKRAIKEATEKEWADYEASRDPYEDERQLCSTLIKYLRRYLTSDIDIPLGASAISPGQSPSVSVSAPVVGRDDKMNPEGEFVILKKKIDDDDDVFLQTSAKKKRASRKHSRRFSWLSKPIKHTAPIFSQFDTIGLHAPSTIGEVPDAIHQLTAKKNEYDKMVRQESVHSGGLSVENKQETNSKIKSSALDKLVTSVEVLSLSQHVISNDNDCLNHNILKHDTADTSLPLIDINSAQAHSIQRQANSTPGIESAPETPNSGCSSIPRDNDGDLDIKDVDSVDSGIGIHRLKNSSSVLSSVSVNTSEALKCTDANANTTRDESSENQELYSQMQSEDCMQGYIEVSMLRDEQLDNETRVDDLMRQGHTS